MRKVKNRAIFEQSIVLNPGPTELPEEFIPESPFTGS